MAKSLEATERRPGTQLSGQQTTTEYLNAYDILDLSGVRRAVTTYSVTIRRPKDRGGQTHSEARDAMWQAKKMFPSACPGYGFVISVDEMAVAVPTAWVLPTPIDTKEFSIVDDRSWRVDPADPEDAPIVAGMIQDAVKKHFKRGASALLGPCWQDYGDFCQMPAASNEEFAFCRKFAVTPKRLAGSRWVLQFRIGTAALDTWTFDRYLQHGDGTSLASRVQALASGRINPDGKPGAIRVWWDQSRPNLPKAEVVALFRPEELFQLCDLPVDEQPTAAGATVRVTPFSKSTVEAPVSHLRLVVDTRLTAEEHGRTIIEPLERLRLTADLRDFVNGMDLGSGRLELAPRPIELSEFPCLTVAPQRLRACGRFGAEMIEPPTVHNENGLRERARRRWDLVRKYGFVETQRMRPILACGAPAYDQNRADMLRKQLNDMPEAKEAGISFDEALVYRRPEEIARAVAGGSFDSALVVLPESRRDVQDENDTHDRIKRTLQVASQCIYHDNTLPYAIARKRPQARDGREAAIAARSARTLDVCITNLLTKHSGIPFAPAERHAFNTHVGIDVGGRLNDTVVVCVGTGYEDPRRGLFYLPDEIVLRSRQAEPIPHAQLASGLVSIFDRIVRVMRVDDPSFSFGPTLFFKDGVLRECAGGGHEADALRVLHEHANSEGWIEQDDAWTACEVSKASEGWRAFRDDCGIRNLMVGRAIRCFEDPAEAIVFTTGAPFVTQGTANPLKLRGLPIAGPLVMEDVIRDTVWEADLAFTKPDVVLSLPWVLKVADSGALQLAKQYRLAGISA